MEFGTRAAAGSPDHAFSSRLISFRKRQSVPSAMILLGLDLIMPISWSRRAKNRSESSASNSHQLAYGISVSAWRARDPLVVLATRLLEAGAVTQDELDAVMGAARERVEAAVEHARSAPVPGPEEVFQHVFAS